MYILEILTNSALSAAISRLSNDNLEKRKKKQTMTNQNSKKTYATMYSIHALASRKQVSNVHVSLTHIHTCGVCAGVSHTHTYIQESRFRMCMCLSHTCIHRNSRTHTTHMYSCPLSPCHTYVHTAKSHVRIAVLSL